MKCGIVSCEQKDNRYLWRCHGTCNRQFHAACVGTQRHHEDILRTFVLPLCRDCQEKFTTKLNLNTLEVSWTSISENIGKTLEANHKLLTNFKTLSATHDDALETIENMLQDIKHHVSNAASSAKISTAEIKNSMSSLLDTPPVDTIKAIAEAAATAAVAAITTTTKAQIEGMEKATAAVSAITTTTTSQSINDLPQLITDLKNDLENSQAHFACQVTSNLEEMVKNISSKPVIQESIAEELNNVAQQSSSGWRFLGTIKKWKPDWTEYDAKLERRAIQQKAMDKAAKQRKKRRRCRNSNNNNNIRNNTEIIRIPESDDNQCCTEITNDESKNIKSTLASSALQPLPLDKDLLAAARIQFSGTSSTETTCKFINFQQGETINPYRAEKPSTNTNEVEDLPLLDPMRPPIVRLTQQSANGDRRFLNARLRDPKIMNIVRTYLSYLHDQPPAVCVNGTTKISSTVMLAAEGLPTDTKFLREIFLDVHEELGISRNDAMADLQSHRTFLTSERTQRLQRIREASLKFHSPLNFHRN